jgi:hypothetical protein
MKRATFTPLILLFVFVLNACAVGGTAATPTATPATAKATTAPTAAQATAVPTAVPAAAPTATVVPQPTTAPTAVAGGGDIKKMGTAWLAAKSARVKATLTNEGQTIQITIEVSNPDKVHTKVDQGGQIFEYYRLANAGYAFEKGVWTKTTPDEGDPLGISSSKDIKDRDAQIADGTLKTTEGSVVTVNGEQCKEWKLVGVKDGKTDETWCVGVADNLPRQVKTTDGKNVATYSDWNTPIDITPPAAALAAIEPVKGATPATAPTSAVALSGGGDILQTVAAGLAAKSYRAKVLIGPTAQKVEYDLEVVKPDKVHTTIVQAGTTSFEGYQVGQDAYISAAGVWSKATPQQANPLDVFNTAATVALGEAIKNGVAKAVKGAVTAVNNEPCQEWHVTGAGVDETICVGLADNLTRSVKTTDGVYTYTYADWNKPIDIKFPDAALAAGGALAAATSSPATGTGGQAKPGGPVVFQGKGDLNTKAFSLADGNYSIAWTATRAASTGCTLYGNLATIADNNSFQDFNSDAKTVNTTTGQTEANNVKAGLYYVRVSTSCETWSVAIGPQGADIKPALAGPATASLPLTGPPVVPASDQPIVLTGNGDLNTKAFALAGGNYTIAWTATRVSSTDCGFNGFIKDAGNSSADSFYGRAGQGNTTSGTSQTYGVKAGLYYFRSSTSCEAWTVAIAPYGANAAALLTGQATSPLPGGDAALSQSKEPPIVMQGSGDTNSLSFALAGGNYTVAWTATRATSTGCSYSGSLALIDNSDSENFDGDAGNRNTTTGVTQLYSLKASQYYLRSSSGCDTWTIVIAPYGVDTKAALGGPATSPLPGGLPPSATGEPPVTLKGTGDSTTKQFNLVGGAYTIAFTATRPSSTGCSLNGNLRSADDKISEYFAAEARTGNTANGQTQVYAIKPGAYFFKMRSDCDNWTIAIGPQGVDLTPALK